MLEEKVINDIFDEYSPEIESYEYEVIRQIISPEFQGVSSQELENIVDNVLSEMSPEEMENFWKTVKSIGQSVGNILPQVLPLAGSVVGGIYGGPAGAALGGSVGSMAGNLVGNAVSQNKQKKRPSIQRILSSTTIPPSSSASTQLMSFLQNPQFLQSILGMALGSKAKKTIPVGSQGAKAPNGAFLNTLIQLAVKALGESSSKYEGEVLESVEYLYDSGGNLLCEDIASPEERSMALLENIKEMHTGVMSSSIENSEIQCKEDTVIGWLADANIIESYEEYSSAESVFYGEKVFQRAPDYLYEMYDRVNEWNDSSAKRRLICLFSGIIDRNISDLRYYNRNWVRRVSNYEYAVGTATAALSDLNAAMIYYKNFKSSLKSQDDFIQSIDDLITNGIIELRKYLVIWSELPQVQEMANYVIKSKENSKSIYYCYKDLI